MVRGVLGSVGTAVSHDGRADPARPGPARVATGDPTRAAGGHMRLCHHRTEGVWLEVLKAYPEAAPGAWALLPVDRDAR